jgi:citrate synthase
LVFDPELRSITVTETALSGIDGRNGDLVISGLPVEELAEKATYEECVYLLFNNRLPTASELETFQADLISYRAISDDVRYVLACAADEQCSAMDALRMGTAAAVLGTTVTGTRSIAKRIVAVLPTLAATYWRYRQGEQPISPDEELGHAANYLYMLTGGVPDKSRVRGLETTLVTLIEHGLNPSTFAARVVVSTQSDLFSAATAGIGALKGTQHGGALSSIFEMIEGAHESDDTKEYIRNRLGDDARLSGFGHRVYRIRDPRVAILVATAERFYDDSSESADFLDTTKQFESIAVDLLSENAPEHQVQTTVDFYTSTLLHSLGVPKEMGTATFAVSRIAGWMAHCLEQLKTGNLVRPKSRYVGATDRTWTAIENRSQASDVADRSSRPSSLEPASEILATLSEPTRLEILLILHRNAAELAYSVLRTKSSIEDNGRFNYHLRQLGESDLVSSTDGYALTDTGKTLVQTLIANDHLFGDRPE